MNFHIVDLAMENLIKRFVFHCLYNVGKNYVKSDYGKGSDNKG